MEENVIENKDLKKGKLSILSLIFFLVRIGTTILSICIGLFQALVGSNNTFSIVLSFFSMIISLISFVPWTIISLVLAIIGKVRDKDKLSTIMLIINIVYISLQVLVAIGALLLIFLGIATIMTLD